MKDFVIVPIMFFPNVISDERICVGIVMFSDMNRYFDYRLISGECEIGKFHPIINLFDADVSPEKIAIKQEVLVNMLSECESSLASFKTFLVESYKRTPYGLEEISKTDFFGIKESIFKTLNSGTTSGRDDHCIHEPIEFGRPEIIRLDDSARMEDELDKRFRKMAHVADK